MESYTREQLTAMKRPELQKICKAAGIKANLKNVELIEAYWEHQTSATPAAATDSAMDTDIIALPATSTDTAQTTLTLPSIEPVASIEISAPVEAAVVAPVTPVPAPSTRRRTYDLEESAAVICKQKTPRKEVSTGVAVPATTEALAVSESAKTEDSIVPVVFAVSEDVSTMDALKAALMSEVDKRVGIVSVVATGKKTGTKGAAAKSMTPKSKKNWDKIHTQTFEKMESIDDYLLKKKGNGGGITKATAKKGIVDSRKSIGSELKLAAVARAVETAQQIKAKNVGFTPSDIALKAVTPARPMMGGKASAFTPKAKTPAADMKSVSKFNSVAKTPLCAEDARRKSIAKAQVAQGASKIPIARAILRPSSKSNAIDNSSATPAAPVKAAKSTATAHPDPKVAHVQRSLEESHMRRSSNAFEELKIRRKSAVEAFRRLSAGTMQRMRRTGALPKGIVA